MDDFRWKGGLEALGNNDPEMRTADDKNAKHAPAHVQGKSLQELEGFDASLYDLPVFFPTVAMSDEEVSEMASGIRSGF